MYHSGRTPTAMEWQAVSALWCLASVATEALSALSMVCESLTAWVFPEAD